MFKPSGACSIGGLIKGRKIIEETYAYYRTILADDN